MITVFGFEITLPQILSFLSGSFGSFLGTFIVSIVIAFIAYFLIFVLLKLGFSWTDTEADDVILAVTRWPFIIFSILFSLERSIEVWGHEGLVGGLERVLWALMAIVITYWIAALIKNVALYELKRYSKWSEAAWDDVLAPVLERIVPPLIWIVGLVVFLQSLGLDLTGLYVALGGTAFILGFALQDVLSNLFSGLVLLLDTPFQFGDVVQLEDGTIAVVKDIGLRVTHFYNTKDHSDIYVPNSVLGGMIIVNITRPTTDLAASIGIGVAYTADSKYNGSDNVQKNVTDILKKVIMGHPDVFGDIDKKLDALADFSQFLSGQEKIDEARKRLEVEKRLNEKLENLEGQLDGFAGIASLLEKDGLDGAEKKQLEQVYSDILATAGLKVILQPKRWLSSTKPHIEEDDKNEGLFQLVRDWCQAWLLDPDLVKEDNDGLRDEWERKLSFLRMKLERLCQYVINPTGHERRLDNEAKKIVGWIHGNFKESRVLWKDPDIRLVNFGASSLDFEVSYYVDDIKLEHYERSDRIQDELRREIKFRFDEAGIEIPFPQTDIWFRSTLEARNAK
ncbi:MAG: mechanosensitive ion channel [Anaerolineales bacterium]|nr:mechanosensitive ion channel [Anaerolineales bacterium]